MPQGPQDAVRAGELDAETRDALTFEVAFFEGILSRRPDMLDALRPLAHAYTELGYFEDGLAIDRRICRLDTGDPVAVYNLACSHALTGQVNEALDALERAWDLGYRDPEHMRRDRDLAALQGLARFQLLLRRGRSASAHSGWEGREPGGSA